MKCQIFCNDIQCTNEARVTMMNARGEMTLALCLQCLEESPTHLCHESVQDEPFFREKKKVWLFGVHYSRPLTFALHGSPKENPCKDIPLGDADELPSYKR